MIENIVLNVQQTFICKMDNVNKTSLIVSNKVQKEIAKYVIMV